MNESKDQRKAREASIVRLLSSMYNLRTSDSENVLRRRQFDKKIFTDKAEKKDGC